MATGKKKTNVDQMIDKADDEALEAEGVEKQPEEEARPSYKKFPDSRIPISKAAGSLWKSRHDQGVAKLKNSTTYEAWDECISYYKNDQSGKRNRENPDLPSAGSSKQITGGTFAQTENVVFANVSALVPSIYAKNPDVSVHSPKGDIDLAFTTCAQKLLRTLMQKRVAPGINLKPKARRAVVMTTLTNISYIEVGYNRRENAVEGSLAEIDEISRELEKAKNPKDIEELEGKLQALDDKIDLLQPSGPWTRVLHPKDVIIDPDAQLPDCSDAKWIMIKDVYDTSYINAVYRQKNEDGQMESIYKPSHVVKAGSGTRSIHGHDDEITNFSLLQGDEHSPRAYGYEDDRTFKRAQRTFVWKVWDRITRRVYMYAEHDWSWPIWVWDDPYGLDDFFPVFPLAFHTDPEDMYARGEVSYYLDQQDEINRINSQVSKMRHRISNQLVYNKRAIKDEGTVLRLIEPVDGNQLVGIDLPEGMKLADVLGAPPIPSVEYAQLFDKRSLFEAIDRVSGVSSVVKGVEYKTNTTNKAIDSYESSSAMRLDEKIDAIEELVGRIGYAVLFLCLQFMSQEEVVTLIGAENAKAWPGNMSPREAQRAYTCTVTGGSSLKPTSKVRKEQAKETAQIIGQFGQASPVAFLIVLKMFQRAFSDELVLEPADWEMLVEALTGQIKAEQQKAAGPQRPPQQGNGATSPQPEGEPIDPQAIIGKISQAIERMPDNLRKRVGDDIAKGVPLEEILGKLSEVLQQAVTPDNGARQ